MTLVWRGNTAYDRDGRPRFAVAREKHGFYLYRYTIRLDGISTFRSKEKVRDRAAGMRYADNLWALSGGRTR